MNITQLNQDFSAFTTKLAAWAATALPNVVGALLILGIGWWLSGVAARAIAHVVEKQPYVDPTLQGVLKRLVRWGLLVMVFVAALTQLGVATTSMLAALGAIGLAVGLALQGTLANIAAGIMILWLRPFRVGDYIDAGSAAGTVKDVGLFASHMTTFEGVALFVPNSELWGTKIVNYTRSAPAWCARRSASLMRTTSPRRGRCCSTCWPRTSACSMIRRRASSSTRWATTRWRWNCARGRTARTGCSCASTSSSAASSHSTLPASRSRSRSATSTSRTVSSRSRLKTSRTTMRGKSKKKKP